MQVKQTSSEKLKRSYDITIPLATIEARMNARLVSIGRDAKIKGFRKGKAPIDIIKKQYGNAVRGEVLEQVVNETSKQALKQNDVTPAVAPKIQITEFKEGKDLVYSMEVELFPEIPNIDYKKIVVEKLEIEVAEDDVDKSLARLVEQTMQTKPAPDSYAAKNGDSVKIDFEGFVNDVAFAGGKAEGFVLKLGSGQFIPGFEDQLIGGKKGESKSINVDFPQNYQSKELAGQKARFDVKIHEVLQEVPAVLNDDLAKEFGVANVAEMRERMRKQLEKDREKYVRFKLKEKLFDELQDKYDFEVPDSMQKLEFDTIWQQVQHEAGHHSHDPNHVHGPDCDHAGDEEKDEKLRKEYEQIAHRRVALGIILSTLGKREKIEVEQKDVVEAINEKAAQFPGQEQQVKDFFQKNPNAVQELLGPILEEKVVDFLLAKVTVNSRKTSLQELLDGEEAANKKGTSGDKKSAKKKSKK